jgi:hypothetical protein
MLRAIFGRDAEFVALTISNGGAEIELRMKIAGLPCSISLARNADARRRIIDVEDARGQLRLDLSEGDGRIFDGQEELDKGPAETSTPGPLALMLSKFLECVADGTTDDRLSAATAIEDCRIADQILPVYRRKQAEWLAQRLDRQLDPDISYALSELLYGIAPREPLDGARIAGVWSAIVNLGAGPLIGILIDPIQRDQELRRLLARAGRSANIPS